MKEHIYNIYNEHSEIGKIHIQGKLAHMNDFIFLRKELLELHCRIGIGSSFQTDAPTKDRENCP